MLHGKERFLVRLLTVMNGRDFINLFENNHDFICFIDGIICFSGLLVKSLARFEVDENGALSFLN